MIDDAAYDAWLIDPAAKRVLLAELHHSAGIEYVSSKPYISWPGDSLPSQPFDDVLRDAVDITQRIDSQPEIGDLELTDNGRLTDWIQYKWAGWPVVLLLGDARWSYDDYRVFARQLSAGVQSAERGRMVLGVVDASTLLDDPIDRLYHDGQPVPFVLGTVFCGAAIPTSTSTLRYRASQLAVTSLVVRDGNGPVVSHTAEYTTGEFVLAAYTPRTPVCEISEPHNTPALIIAWVADHYDIDVGDLEVPTVTVGLRYDSADISGRQILDDLCQSIGAHWRINLAGELEVKVWDVATEADLTIVADDIEYGQIRLTETRPPVRGVTVHYARNYTPMTEVAGSIHDTDPALADRLRSEWLTTVATLSQPDFPAATTTVRETVLQDPSDAEDEADRLLDLASVQRETWELNLVGHYGADLVRRGVTIMHPRLADRIGRIVYARQNPVRERVTVGVWF